MPSISKSAKFFAVLAFSLFLLPAIAFGQYKLTPLVSNEAPINGVPADADLINGWGLTRADRSPVFPNGTPFWVSDNVTGKSTLYTGAGQKQGLIVTIPPAAAGTKGSPTGTVFNITFTNQTPSFSVSNGTKSGTAIFIFATLDGIISGWNPGVDRTNAVIAVDRSSFGAVYTGLAITSDASGDFLYATDNGPNSRIDVFDKNFTWVRSFT
ncbi:MAG TPA: TIGR03118 family protein, partial [Candidatus Acidoferrum sp.]